MPRAPRRPAVSLAPSSTQPHARGFTLVELMVTLAISSVVGAGVIAASLWQIRSQVGKLAEMDARAQAQTILAALAESASFAGFGFGHANDAEGVAATGVCMPLSRSDYLPGWGYGRYVTTCRGIDNNGNNDRVRFAYADPGMYCYYAASAPTAGPCGTDNSPPNPALLHLSEVGDRSNTGQGSFGRGMNMFLGGRCQGGGTPSAATDLIGFDADSGPPQAQCYEIRSFNRGNMDGGPSSGMSCPKGYAPGFTFGVGEIRELYSDTDPTSGLPRLMMGGLAWGQPPSVVAVGVTRFEVTYGFDTSSTRDTKLDPCPTCTEDPYGSALGGPYAWCREARAESCPLTDDNGVALTTKQLQSRIIALHVSLDLVAPPQTAAFTRLAPLAAGTKKWTFSRVFHLPNLAL